MAQDTKMMADSLNKPLFSWSEAEFSQYKKSANWYIIISFVAVLLALFFVWQKNYTAMGVVIAACVAFIAQANIKPKKIKCEIYPNGVVINQKAYSFDIFKSFWIIISDEITVKFQPQGRLSSLINMPVSKSEDIEQIRLYLAKHLPEDEDKGEDITDIMRRWIRF